jgi:diguanylate cyclase (GGDEF)-like protein
LAKSLVDNLYKLIQAHTISLYELSDTDGHLLVVDHRAYPLMVNDVLNREGELIPIESLPGLKECMRTQKMVLLTVSKLKKPRSIFPVRGPQLTIGFLVIDLGDINAQSAYIIETLLRAYANQRYILLRNECDTLTGLLNRQAFERKIPDMISRQFHGERRTSARNSSAYLAFLDVDHFKRFNDQHGHLFGDEILLHLAQLMIHSFRHDDMLFRFGGDEFAIVLRNVDVDTALKVLNKFRKIVAVYRFPRIRSCSVSIGIAQLNAHDSLSNGINKADRALYHAKSHGRNQVQVYERLRDDGKLEESNTPSGNTEPS